MKAVGLDGREYTFTPANNQSNVSDTNRSKLHKKAFKLAQEFYPHVEILEEVSLPGSRVNGGSVLQADIFLPIQKIIIEVHGEQHYNYIPFFHKNKRDFFRAKARDVNKRRWAEINGFIFIELPYNETEDEWKERLC
jgi:hypothetical protein